MIFVLLSMHQKAGEQEFALYNHVFKKLWCKVVKTCLNPVGYLGFECCNPCPQCTQTALPPLPQRKVTIIVVSGARILSVSADLRMLLDPGTLVL